MKKTRPVATVAAVITLAAMASVAHAQTKPVQGWQPPQHEEPDPAKRVPEARQTVDGAGTPQPYAQPQAVQPQAVQSQAYDAEQSAPARYEDGRGGFFVGVQGGKGWVYEDVDQSALAVNAGYRWQAGAVSLIGVEVATGRLDSTTDDGWSYEKVEYGSVGVNARFNFGRSSPVYGLVRAGYWSADSDAGMEVDGGYFGLGLGADINRHFNLSLVYTNYVYFEDYYWEGDDFYYDINRADTLMFGAEVRF